MPNWDEDSPELRQSLTQILSEISERAERREPPTVELARRWQRLFMQGLDADRRNVGAFRGERGLERTGVRIGPHRGTPAARVAEELKGFEEVLHVVVARLDEDIPRERTGRRRRRGSNRFVRLGACGMGTNPSFCKRKRPHLAPLGQLSRAALWAAAFRPLTSQTR